MARPPSLEIGFGKECLLSLEISCCRASRSNLGRSKQKSSLGLNKWADKGQDDDGGRFLTLRVKEIKEALEERTPGWRVADITRYINSNLFRLSAPRFLNWPTLLRLYLTSWHTVSKVIFFVQKLIFDEISQII